MRNLTTLIFCLLTWAVHAKQEYGMASVYSSKFHGNRTASGEIYVNTGFTAAHRELPFGSLVKVTRVDNGKWVVVRINDRGPFVGDLVLDMSKSAAGKLNMQEKEVAKVQIEVLSDRSLLEGTAGVSQVRTQTPVAYMASNARPAYVAPPTPQVNASAPRKNPDPRDVPSAYNNAGQRVQVANRKKQTAL